MSKPDLEKASRQAKSQRLGKPPPNYGSRGEQLRLFVLCGMLMLVLVMMNEARKPATWAWLWGEQPTVVEETPIDTRLDMKEPLLPSDGFTFKQQPNQERAVGDAAIGEEADKGESYFPGVSPELLAPVLDNTVFRAAESEAWNTLLNVLKETNEEEIAGRSLGKIGFAQLFRQMDFYRGKVVTATGIVRRLEVLDVDDNNTLGNDRLYRWILQPPSVSSSPIVVYTLTCPPDLVPGDDLSELCEFHGICFKRWAYPAADGTRVAPVLVAKSCIWQPPAPAPAVVLPSNRSILLITLGVIALASVFAFVVYRSTNVKRDEIDRLRAPNQPLDELRDEPVLSSITESLKTLEREQP